MFEVIFLVLLGIVWLVFASIQDFKKNEIANWLNFSLIIFALGFRFFYSLFNASPDFVGFEFFIQGIFGLGFFFIVSLAFYYSRFFAGGDAKLLIALGAILAFYFSIKLNLILFAIFLFVFLFVGSIYGLFWAGYLSIKNFQNFKKRFFNDLRKNKNLIKVIFGGVFVLLVAGIFNFIFIVYGFVLFIFVLLFFYLEAVDKSCMRKKIKTSELVEGDWLYNEIKIKNKKIKPHWEGLNKEQISFIRKNLKYVNIKQGIPFAPVFLISFLILVYLYYSGFALELFKVFF
ncbi:prepilin peptidase [Candidatus Babeliales bacterium]|nr:prepilin peptidase [Candidatus Babeliales bacterium]MCF7910137.1 prepilin peptidase [Candidatus Pacearchaeota archaeon]